MLVVLSMKDQHPRHANHLESRLLGHLRQPLRLDLHSHKEPASALPPRSTRHPRRKSRKCAHLVLEHVGREHDAVPVDVGLDEGEGAPDAVEGHVGEAEVGRHVDEVLAVRVELAIACSKGRNE